MHVKAEVESGTLSFQSLLTRLASDASALANIVPLSSAIGRLRSDSGQAEVAELRGESEACALPSTVPENSDEIELQLKEELKAQGQKKGLLEMLRHWRSTASNTSDDQPGQVALACH